MGLEITVGVGKMTVEDKDGSTVAIGVHVTEGIDVSVCCVET
jgi:hypothetical protein